MSEPKPGLEGAEISRAQAPTGSASRAALGWSFARLLNTLMQQVDHRLNIHDECRNHHPLGRGPPISTGSRATTYRRRQCVAGPHRGHMRSADLHRDLAETPARALPTYRRSLAIISLTSRAAVRSSGGWGPSGRDRATGVIACCAIVVWRLPRGLHLGWHDGRRSEDSSRPCPPREVVTVVIEDSQFRILHEGTSSPLAPQPHQGSHPPQRKRPH